MGADVGKIGPPENRELHSGLQIEKCDCAMFELPADDAGCGQAQAIPVKRQRSFEVIDTKREDRDPRLHGTYT